MQLITNREDFYNDICEVIRLFTPGVSIELLKDVPLTGDALSVLVCESGDHSSRAVFLHNGERFSYEYALPSLASSGKMSEREALLEKKRLEKRSAKIAAFRAMHEAFPSAHLPWGSLTGIRPTRLLRDLIDRAGEETALNLMREEFEVSEEKLALARNIVSVQRPILTSATARDIDLYIGIPFCRTRCLYCSFASELRTKKTDMAAYLEALKKDITLGAELLKSHSLRLRAAYLGGGTPTVLTEDELAALLDHAANAYGFSDGMELTVEAGRPDTISEGKLRVMKSYGVTRISINPQTMNDKTLKTVGRDHNADDIRACFNLAREIGFDSINMDVIAGLPGENADDMRATCEAIAELEPDCLTVHTLAIKRSSRLHEKLESYELPLVREVEEMTAIGAECAQSLGMLPYYMYRQKYMAGNMENVGYSKPDRICVYNIDMMEDSLSILSNGAGAMTKRVFAGEKRIERIPNPKDISTYIQKIDKTHKQRLKLWNE